MSIVPDIAPMIAAWPPASLLRLAGEPVDSKAELTESLEKFQVDLRRETRAVQAQAESLRAAIRQMRNKIGSSEIRDIDVESVILKFEDAERRIARDRRLSKLAAELRSGVPRHSRQNRERFDRCLRLFSAFRLLVLRTMRDVRWELMAFDALRRGELSGPVFVEPRRLRRHLSKLAI